MTENGKVVPNAKKRLQVLNSMPAALQEVAQEADRRLSKGAQGLVLIRYDVGGLVRDVAEESGKYGSDAVGKLADYLGLRSTTLYALRDFAASFDRDYVSEWTVKPMSDGGYMTESHWLALRKVAKVGEREALLKKTLRESFSANELEAEIMSSGVKTKNVRTGGRKPSVPTSPLAGLQKFGNLALSLYNYGVLAEQVFDNIDEAAPDAVNETLLTRLKETKDTLEKAAERLESSIKHIDENVERVEGILETKAEEEAEAKAKAEEEDEDGDSDEDADEKPKKKKKKLKKPAAAN